MWSAFSCCASNPGQCCGRKQPDASKTCCRYGDNGQGWKPTTRLARTKENSREAPPSVTCVWVAGVAPLSNSKVATADTDGPKVRQSQFVLWHPIIRWGVRDVEHCGATENGRRRNQRHYSFPNSHEV